MSSLSWRINVAMNNQSQRTLVSPSSGTGATVVRAQRSLDYPVLFDTGETDKMLAMFGAPSSSNPELLEALEYNTYYPLYVSSPALKGRHASAVITGDGVVALKDGVDLSSSDLEDLSDVVFSCSLTPTTMEGTTVYSGVVASSNRNSYSLVSKIMNTSTSSSVSDTTHFVVVADTEYPLTLTQSESDHKIYEVTNSSFLQSGTLNSSTGEVSLILASNIQTSFSRLELKYHVEISGKNEIFGLIVSRAASTENHLQVRVTKNVYSNSDSSATYSNPYSSFSIAYRVLNSNGKFVAPASSPVEFGDKKTTVDAYGTSLNPEKVFDGNPYLTVYVNYLNGNSISSYLPQSTSYVTLVGGYHDIEDIDFAGGWDEYRDSDTYQMDLVFDASCNSDALTHAAQIRTGGYQPYVRVLLPIARPATYTDYTSVLSVKESAGYPVNRGVSLYFGYFKIQNSYSTDGDVTWIPMGEIAKRHADSIRYSYGGLATAWVDENGVGGQLTGGRILKSIYKMSENDLQLLDENRINPVIYDRTFGPMIVSRRTTIMDNSDYSFNDYSGTFDYILRRVVENVLPYQLVKFNDSDHRRVVKSKIESIVQPLTVAPYNVLNAYLVKCDSENNDAEVLNKEEFHVDLAVQVTAKSRWIYFTFTNTSQTVSVEEVLA